MSLEIKFSKDSENEEDDDNQLYLIACTYLLEKFCDGHIKISAQDLLNMRNKNNKKNIGLSHRFKGGFLELMTFRKKEEI